MPRSPLWWTPRRDVEMLLDDEDDGASGLLGGPSASDDWADERTFIPLGGGSWERRLTRREKVLRGAGSVAVVLVITLVLLGGPGSVLAYLANVTRGINPALVARAAASPASNALDVPMPANIAENPRVSLSPVNGPTALAYACWVDEPPNELGERVAALHVADYAVATHNWTLLAQPVAASAGCAIVTDMTVPERVVVALTRAADAGSADGACQLPDLYRSEDGGAHWAPLRWPSAALAPCNVQFEMEGGRLYVQSDTRLLPAGDAASDAAGAGLIAVTADGGATWAAADGGLAGLSRISLVALRPGGRLLAQGIDSRRQGSTTLWQSDDAGAHWRFLMAVPGAQARVYASSDPRETANGGWGRLYAYSGASGAASGSSLRGLTSGFAGGGTGATLATTYAEPAWMLSRLQPNGAAVPLWSGVALEPDAANKDQRPAGAWQGDAGEGPNGGVMFTEPNASGNPTNIISPYNLVVWDGQAW
ncbi:MAG: hypothetical protein ACHQ4H_18590, partial [Ktedonobacterales bacterium]